MLESRRARRISTIALAMLGECRDRDQVASLNKTTKHYQLIIVKYNILTTTSDRIIPLLCEHMTNSNSCIDYSNSHFARQNNNGIEKPIPNKPQTIPIYQQ